MFLNNKHFLTWTRCGQLSKVQTSVRADTPLQNRPHPPQLAGLSRGFPSSETIGGFTGTKLTRFEPWGGDPSAAEHFGGRSKDPERHQLTPPSSVVHCPTSIRNFSKLPAHYPILSPVSWFLKAHHLDRFASPVMFGHPINGFPMIHHSLSMLRAQIYSSFPAHFPRRVQVPTTRAAFFIGFGRLLHELK